MKIKVMQNVYQSNDDIAAQIRADLARRAITMVNLIGSPGSGKTSVLEKLIPLITENGLKCGVIEGDCATSNDAERIARLAVPVVQINTGGGCHLDAKMIQEALVEIDYANLDMILIENIGNMVCPSGWDLGELEKWAVISTAEGHDKPEKYPDLFYTAKKVLLTKVDLIPYTNFDETRFLQSIRSVNAEVPVIRLALSDNDTWTALWTRLHALSVPA